MGFLDFLSGGSQIGGAQGVDINKDDFKIKNADALYNQTQNQYNQAAAQQPNLNNQASSFLNNLQASANGTAPSVSTAMLKQAQDRNLQQQLAMAASQRGGNPAAAQRELLRAQSSGAATAANQGVTAGLQEQQQNKQLYQTELGRQQTAVAQATQQYLQQGFSIEQAQEQALADYNHLNVQQALGLAGVNEQGQATQAGLMGGLMSGLIGGAATAMGKPSGG